MHKQFYLFLVCFIFINFLSANSEPFWGATGHRTVGVIAQEHLTKKASKEIDKLLQGESLAFVSTFGDDIKSDPKYRKLSPWHYVNFPFDTKYEDSDISKDGDIITGIDYCINVLKDKNSSKEDQAFYLKFLVHLIASYFFIRKKGSSMQHRRDSR